MHTIDSAKMKEESGVGIVIFIIVWAAYILSSYPSVAGGDSGELVAEACVSTNFDSFFLFLSSE